jgi:general secretion pathway protein K
MTRLLTGLWTFLNRERSLGGGRRPAPRPRRRRQRGVAIITVLIAIALTLVLTNQFSTSTSIDLIAAANHRDQMRAHFLARSAVNLSELVIRLQQKLDAASKNPQLKQFIPPGTQVTDFANQLMLAFCGSPEEVHSAVGDAASLSKGLGADIGTCGVVGTITTEDDKLNLNCANSSSNAAVVESALSSLVYFSAYDPLFEEADAENWRRDRALQVSALLDYIDRDTTRGVIGGANKNSGGATEDYGYESLKDDYRAKNNYLDTVGELKLVRGVDDRFWTLFGPALTVYGGCKLNLSALTNVQLIAAILSGAAHDKEKSGPVLQDPQKLFALAGIVAKAKLLGVQFEKVDEFIAFVKDPVAAVGALAGETSMAGSQAAAALNAGLLLPGGQKLGLELDASRLNGIVTVGPRRTYRVEAWGEVDRKSTEFPPIRSTITGVWVVRVQNQNARKASPSTAKGTWVFLRED